MCKEIKMTCPLGIEEDRQSRVKQKLVIAQDQPRRALVDEITFQIEKTAQLQLKMVSRIADGQRVVDLIEQIAPARAFE
ncbi:MAG: hypothetical protein DME34_04105, partial [Verrucomicrobia bacterium]